MEVNEAKIIKSIILINGKLTLHTGEIFIKIIEVVERKGDKILIYVSEVREDLKFYAVYDLKTSKILPGYYLTADSNPNF